MFIALISDIHANLQALDAVVQDARQLAHQASCLDHSSPTLRFWCLGDIFGRGPSPEDVWDRVAQDLQPDCWVVGNHDQELVRLINDPSLGEDKAKREQWEKDFGSLSDATTIIRHWKHFQMIGRVNEIQQQIVNLPVMVSPLPGVYLAHGSFGLNKRPLAERPRECVEEYIKQYREVTTTWEVLSEFVKRPQLFRNFQNMHQIQWKKPSIMIVGHWHIRSFYKFENNRWQPSPIINDDVINLWLDLPNTPAQPVLINPGSVGSPRLPKDAMLKDFCASYAIIDWNERNPRIMFRRVPYDRNKTLRLLRESQYPPKISEKLEGKCTSSPSRQCQWCKES